MVLACDSALPSSYFIIIYLLLPLIVCEEIQK